MHFVTFQKKSKNSVIIKEKKYHLFKLSNKLTATQSQSHIYRNVMILIKKQSQKFMM